jgi:subtilisin family serine protease
MSFSFSTSSRELERALDHATNKGVVAIASAGNDGQRIDVYPAALPTVIGVTSTTDWDALSDFSNYGPSVAWIASPGEAIVTTYPLGTYAAAWGTSFSAPFSSGTAALLAEVSMRLDEATAANAEGRSVWFSDKVQKGRLHAPTAIRAWRERLGLQ